MPVFDTPITTNDQSIERVLAQPLPTLLFLHSGSLSPAFDDALKQVARTHKGNLLVVRVDLKENPGVRRGYGDLNPPAIVTRGSDNREKARVGSISAGDIAAYAANLLEGKPLPQKKQATGSAKASSTGQDKPVVVSDATFEKEVLQSDLPVLVDFWAEWCGPCRSIAPYIEQLAGEYADRLKVAKLDTDRNQMTAGRFGIQAIPTFIVFKNGQVVQRMSGANPTAIRQMVAGVVG
jgi:thioredoxin 1